MKSTAVLLVLVGQVHMLNIWDSSTGIKCQDNTEYFVNITNNEKDVLGHTYEEHQAYCKQRKHQGYNTIYKGEVVGYNEEEEYDQYYYNRIKANPKYKCIIVHKEIVCNNLEDNNPKSMPLEGYPKYYESINFGLSIPNLNAHFFWSQNVMLSIKTINLNNVRMKNIEPSAFDGLLNVETLYLQNNEIKQLENVFGPLTSLKTLNLDNNSITDIQTHTFGSLGKLTSLLLANNNITHIDEESFKFLKELKELDLSNNLLNDFSFKTLLLNSLEVLKINNALLRQTSVPCKIKDMKEDCGTLPSSIKSISLMGNSFTKINNLSLFINLKHFVLSNNSISILDTTFGNEILKISLDYNNLTTLSNALFSEAIKLQELNLNHNQIKDLNEEIFLNTTSLITLSLAQNNLTQLPLSLFKNQIFLRYLNLSGNGLTNIPVGLFDSLTDLEILDLSLNKLQTLDLIKVHALQKLTHLYIENNLISQFEFAKWIFPNLKQLAIHGNLWICEDLLILYHNLKKASVRVLDGSDVPYIKTENINGIGCIENKNVDRNTNNNNLNKSYPDFVNLNADINQIFKNINNNLNATFFNRTFDLNQNLTETFANINNNIKSTYYNVSKNLMAEHIELLKNLNATLKPIFNATQNVLMKKDSKEDESAKVLKNLVAEFIELFKNINATKTVLSSTQKNLTNNVAKDSKDDNANVLKNLEAEHIELFKKMNATLNKLIDSTQESLKNNEVPTTTTEKKQGGSVLVLQIINILVLVFMFATILFYFVTRKMLIKRSTLEPGQGSSEVELL